NTCYVMVLIAKQLMRFSNRVRNDPVATAPGTGCLLFKLPKDRIRSDRGILALGTGLSLEGQRLFEIESNNRIARELKQKISEGARCNRMRCLTHLPFSQFRVTSFDFFQSVGFQPANQIVGLYAEALAAAHVEDRKSVV